MTAALAWLNDLVQWIGRWIPRLVLIHTTHRGVRFGPRGGAHLVGPGLVLFWPITHDLLQVPVTTQSIQLCGQILPAGEHDGFVPRVVVCTLNIQFSLSDPVKASTRVLSFHALVANRAQSLAAKHWPGSYARDDRAWVTNAQEQLTTEMQEYGIAVHSLELASIGLGVTLKNVSDWSYADREAGKRPE